MTTARAPLILLTASTQSQGAEFSDHSLSLSANYSKAVAAAGGVPVAAPNLPSAALAGEMVARADGVLLTGGDDIQTFIYQPDLPEDLKKTTSPPEPARDLFELMVIGEVFRQRKPLFAICRGLQLLNVALGGTMLVDIASQRPGAINHRRMDMKDQIVHSVEVTPVSLLASLTGGGSLEVNSSHHQAADKIAGMLKVTAQSADGIVECLEMRPGVENPPPFLLAVQFHPERLAVRHAAHRALFEGFVRACSSGCS
jgi:putative glutamine amidotransferase